jgi:hypothetical protein
MWSGNRNTYFRRSVRVTRFRQAVKDLEIRIIDAE